MLSFLTFASTVAVALAATSVKEPAESTIEPSKTAIAAAAATQSSLSPISNVKGVAFDRFYQLWLENTDYSAASGDPSLQALAKQGITLTNYWGVTHPSEPNYAAAVGGDHFGMDNDDFHAIPANISTVVDLLDTKGISWAEYQESLPYSGFQGFNYSNQKTFANDYVRKHNPLILYESVTSNATRLELIKNITGLYSDLATQSLPQWAFITPNMTNDGHDTNITFAATWFLEVLLREKNAISMLLNNTYFMNNTLILLTFDEIETYPEPNKVFSILLGGAIPDSLKGTTDDTFYNHYSTIASASVNWGLPSLGRWDCEANVFALVANKTGYANAEVDITNLYFNTSYPGPLSDTTYIPTWPVPDTGAKCASGLGVLDSVKSTWGSAGAATYNYTNVYPYDASSDNNAGGTPVVGGQASSGLPSASGTTSSTASTTSEKPAATSSASAGEAIHKSSAGPFSAFFGLVVALFL